MPKNNAAAKQVETNVEKKFPTTEEMIAQGLTTKSARIRHLHSLGMSTGDIARQETNGLYQHAFNVIKKPLKKVAKPAEVAEETATPQEA